MNRGSLSLRNCRQFNKVTSERVLFLQQLHVYEKKIVQLNLLIITEMCVFTEIWISCKRIVPITIIIVDHQARINLNSNNFGVKKTFLFLRKCLRTLQPSYEHLKNVSHASARASQGNLLIRQKCYMKAIFII